MSVVFIIYLIFLWFITSILNYFWFAFLYREGLISEYIDCFSVKDRNIILRAYVILGPISFAIASVFMVLVILCFIGKYAYGWVIEDNEQIV